MTFNNPLSPLFVLQNHVLDSVWRDTRLAHSLPYFTSSKVIGHSNLTMYSLLFPFRTPLPHRLHPCYVPPLFRLCSPPFSVVSQLILIYIVLLAGCSLRNFPSPLLFASVQVRWQKPDPSLPSLPVPVPNLLRLQFHIYFLNSRIFHSLVEGSKVVITQMPTTPSDLSMDGIVVYR